MKLLAGMTHALVTIPERDAPECKEWGVRALVDLCFGPGDDTTISRILLVKQGNDLTWVVPHVPAYQNGHVVKVPVFRGQLLVDICHVAARAVQGIKQTFGKPEFGKTYRVFYTNNQDVRVSEELPGS